MKKILLLLVVVFLPACARGPRFHDALYSHEVAPTFSHLHQPVESLALK